MLVFDPISTLKLSVREFLEALGDENRFFTSRALDKRFEDVTAVECITHYIHHTTGITPIGFDVVPAGDMWQYQFEGGDRSPFSLVNPGGG